MAHVLVMTSGLAGVLHASLEVARRLEAAGHRVTCSSPHDVGDVVRANRFTFAEVPPVAFDPAPQLARGDGESRLAYKLREWRTRHERSAAGVTALGMDRFGARLAELRPDLVLLDVELPEHVMTVWAERVPFLLLSQWFEYEACPGLPPLTSDIVPGEGWRGSRAGIAWSRARQRLSKRMRALRTACSYFGTDRRGVLTAHARQLGFPKSALRGLDWVTMFGLAGLPRLNLTAMEWDLPHEPPAGVRSVGPMVLRARADADGGAARDSLQRFCGDARSAGRRIVYAAGTTMGRGDAARVAALVAVARSRSDWALVLGLGRSVEAPADAPDNLLALPWAPQLVAIEEADLVLHHGGIHTLHESLALGTPMLIHPGARADQAACAARMRAHGLAHVSRAADATRPGALASQVAGALDDASLGDRVQAARRRIDDYEAERALERAVEDALRGST